ncbi:MAG: polysaccharide deacetylase family protein [Alphaproteobacteria bacterium]|nr:polysaccharide deacetylase family protein [Alphaproteobacteria bacterium]
MTDWSDLDDELARWTADGRPVTLWWRDDDAVATTPALERLLLLRRRYDIGLGLAVIPASLESSLAPRLRNEGDGITVLQHGYAHQNHAPVGDKKIELGSHRPAPIVIGELGTGQMALARTFGDRFLPVLVPPWNRMAPALVPALPEIGFRGLSAFGLRTRAQPVRGLRQVNAHVDVIAWRGTRGFVGETTALTALVGHLRLRRTSRQAPAIADEPTGVLTHHLKHDDDTWTFLETLWNRLRAHGGVSIVAPSQIFGS